MMMSSQGLATEWETPEWRGEGVHVECGSSTFLRFTLHPSLGFICTRIWDVLADGLMMGISSVMEFLVIDFG